MYQKFKILTNWQTKPHTFQMKVQNGFPYEFTKIIDSKLNKENLKKLGFDAEKIEQAKIKSEVQFAKFSGEDGLKFLNEIKIGIGFAFGYLIMMFIIIYGNMVMRSVIEEKNKSYYRNHHFFGKNHSN